MTERRTIVRNFRLRGILALAAAVAAWALVGCSTPDIANETVGSADGEGITVRELREFLGIRGEGVSAAEVPLATKKEALDRLIAGRLLAREARARGLDNTAGFQKFLRENEAGVLLTALFRKEVSSRLKVPKDEVSAQASKLREADKTLSEDNAALRARRMVSEAQIRKIEEELVAAARKEFPAKIHQEAIDRIGKGEKPGEDAVLAEAGGETVTYAVVKKTLERMSSGGGHGGQDLSTNPAAIGRIVEREATARSLAALAGKQGIGKSEWVTSVRRDMERSILIDMLAETEILKGVTVSDKEIGNAYAQHAQMFVRDGKKIPLAQVKEEIRGFLENEKRRAGLEAFVDSLKKKAKITVNEGMLPKV